MVAVKKLGKLKNLLLKASIWLSIKNASWARIQLVYNSDILAER